MDWPLLSLWLLLLLRQQRLQEWIIELVRLRKVCHFNTSYPSHPSLICCRNTSVVIQDGLIVCVCDRTSSSFCESLDGTEVDEVIDLKGGSLAPGLTSYGSPLGLVEISLEPSTNDGVVFDPLVDGNLPSILGKDTTIIRAVDGLQFQGRNIL